MSFLYLRPYHVPRNNNCYGHCKDLLFTQFIRE